MLSACRVIGAPNSTERNRPSRVRAGKISLAEGESPSISTFLPSIRSARSQVPFGSRSVNSRRISSASPDADASSRSAANFDADPEWLFLTGRLPDVVAVQRAFGSYLGNKMNHPPYTFLRRSPRDPWVRVDGIVHAEVLERETRKMLVGR